MGTEVVQPVASNPSVGEATMIPGLDKAIAEASRNLSSLLEFDICSVLAAGGAIEDFRVECLRELPTTIRLIYCGKEFMTYSAEIITG